MSDFKPSEEVLAEARTVIVGYRATSAGHVIEEELALVAPLIAAEAFRAGETAGREKMEARIGGLVNEPGGDENADQFPNELDRDREMGDGFYRAITAALASLDEGGTSE